MPDLPALSWPQVLDPKPSKSGRVDSARGRRAGARSAASDTGRGSGARTGADAVGRVDGRYAVTERIRAAGKQFCAGDKPFTVRAVTYGTFRPRGDGERFPDR